MLERWLRKAMAVTIACLVFGGVQAEPDAYNTTLSDPGGVALRWENIYAAPLWISGPRPTLKEHPSYPLFRRHSYLHEIDLQPGTTATVQLPQFSALRILATRRKLLRENDLLIQSSNGTGLLIDERPIRAVDDQTLLVKASTHGERIVRLTRPKNYVGRVHVALFLSRVFLPGQPNPFNNELEPRLESVMLRRNFEAAPTRHWVLEKNQPTTLNVSGPRRIKLVSRTRYIGEVRKFKRTTRIETRLNNMPSDVIHIDSGPDSRYVVEIDKCAAVAGRPEERFIDIPKGQHELTLHSSQDLYIRLLEESEKAYLFEKPNKPATGHPTTQRIGAGWRDAVEDNRLSEHVTAIAQDMRTLSRSDPRLQSIARLSNHVLGAYGFWRSLTPRTLGGDAETSQRRFGVPSLASFTEYRRHTALETAQVHAHSNNTYTAWFTNARGKLDFTLPPRKSDTVLRVLADVSRLKHPRRITIRFDNDDARNLNILPRQQIHLDRLRPDPAWQAQRVLDTNGRMDFARRHIANISVVLPAGVSTITLDGLEPDVPVALQQRTSKPGGLDEPQFLSLLQNMTDGEGAKLLLDAIRIALTASPEQALEQSLAAPQRRELVNHSLPLLRLLAARVRNYGAGISLPGKANSTHPDSDRHAATLRQARQLETDKRYLGAFELYSKAMNYAPLDTDTEAAIARIRMLHELGEHALANRLLRGMLLQKNNPHLRDAAWQVLYHHAGDDAGSQLTLLAVRLAQTQTVEDLADLVDVLRRDGKPDMAVAVGMVLPSAWQPVDSLRQAAASAGWWQSLDLLNARAPDAAETAYWSGIRAWQIGDLRQAEKEFEAAGDMARAWRMALREGRTIQNRLRDKPLNADSLDAWASWRFDAPGPRTFSPATELVSKSAGTAWIYAIDRDLGATWVRGNRTTPVVINVPGPARLRISARLAHTKNSAEAKTTWINVDSDSEVQRIAVVEDQPSTGLSIPGDDNTLAGRLTEIQLRVASGANRFQIYPVDGDSFFRVELETSVFDGALLPRIDDDSLSAVMSAKTSADTALKNSVWFTGECRVRDGDGTPLNKLDRWLAQPALPRVAEEPTPVATSLEETLAKLEPSNSAPVIELPKDDPVADLLWQLDRQEISLEHAITETLTAPAPADPRRRQAISNAIRKRANTAWRPVSSITSSAGVHVENTSQWQPESPSLRVRRALISDLAENESLLTGGRELRIALNNLRATTVVADITMDHVVYQPGIPMTVLWATDENAWSEVELTAENRSQRIEAEVGAGQHVFRMKISNPVVNQYLKINVQERRGGVLKPVEREFPKTWQIATRNEPLRVNVKGPALIRVDAQHGDTVVSRMEKVADGWQKLVFGARPDSDSTLYRIHRMVPGAGTPPAPLPKPVRVAIPVAVAVPKLVEPYSTPTLVIEDTFKLGYQEDGTWTHSLGWSRIESDGEEGSNDAPDETSGADSYLEYRFEKRRYTESSPLLHARRWTRFGGVVRLRPDGNPTLGANARADWRFRELPFSAWAQASIFGQRLDQNRDQVYATATTAAAGVTQTRRLDNRTWHVPALSVTLRHTAPGDLRRRSDEIIDRDAYSPYKRTHTCQVRVGDTFYHQPWLDTLWYAGANVTSNDCINPLDPDNFVVRAGWTQLYGDFEVDARYRIRHNLSDDDRAFAKTQHGFRVSGSWNTWMLNQQRLEVKGWWDHDFSDGSNSVYIGAGFNFSQGRQYRDFRPAEVRFRELKESRIPNDHNNVMEGYYSD